MSHSHSHSHDHSHGPSPTEHGRAFIITIVLNSAFVLVEFIYGVIAHSTALMADAGHNLSDVLGLVLAGGAVMLARRAPDQRYTYGLRSSSILAALANAMLLLFACGAIAWEAIERFLDPQPVAGATVMLVAGIGIVINGISALLFMKGRKSDLNIRGAWLHMLADTLVSVGVVAAGAVILVTDWFWLDPIISLVIVAIILLSTLGLLRDSLRLSLNAVPAHIDLQAVQTFLADQSGVEQVHDLHIWGMSTTETALTAHLVMPGGHPGDSELSRISQQLSHDFQIQHTTLQVEHGDNCDQCSLSSERFTEG
ncbi:cation diffusion facilitator family transporter [Marinobacterium litorale]|jgi:cobalt-zinc-cadmium efflux system protein|uniref:cation diffusion facilitator family transporter n=1 Tax=Marinobacterium litorale TaxID=404770 RepID=UPI00040C2CB5|nr:cation diffusion facilitator family transporter [Marinobacterium litorale]